jgi:hypothetical protein
MASLDELRGNFAAEHRRQPTPAELERMAEHARADAQKAAADRRERELEQAFLAVPGTTPELWAKEKAGILSRDRDQQMQANQQAAHASQWEIYKGF